MEGQSPEGVGVAPPTPQERKVPGAWDKLRPNNPLTIEKFMNNGISDALDYIALKTPPKETTVTGEGSEEKNRAIVEQFIPEESREALLQKTQAWEVGKSTGVVVIAGNKETCTAHPHVYEITRTDTGVRLSFVDPEPRLMHWAKPPVVNLLVADITNDAQKSTTLGVLRYRTPSFNPAQINLAPQYAVASELLSHKAKPAFLDQKNASAGALEQETIFRLFTSPTESTLQMRYALPNQMDAFLHDVKTQPAINGKLSSGRHILARFLPLLGTDEEFEQAHFQRKADALAAFERFRPRFKAATSPTPIQMREEKTS